MPRNYKGLSEPQFSPLLFDVTDHLAITEAAKKVEAETGKEGLACLVNNAGITNSGALMLQPVGRYSASI